MRTNEIQYPIFLGILDEDIPTQLSKHKISLESSKIELFEKTNNSLIWLAVEEKISFNEMLIKQDRLSVIIQREIQRYVRRINSPIDKRVSY